VLAYLLNKNSKGLASTNDIQQGLEYEGNNFKKFKPYPYEIKDGRDVYTHASQMH
jgi:hypothetical protein